MSSGAGAGPGGSGIGTGTGTVLVVGECLVDLAPEGEATQAGGTEDRQPRLHYLAMPGGGPANVALGLSRLDITTAFAGRFSRLGFGPWLRHHLVVNGVDVSLSVGADEAATLAVVTLDNEGRASYAFYGRDTADWQWTENELPDLAGPEGRNFSVAAVHTGSLALALEPGAAVLAGWLTTLRRSGAALISFDPNVRPGLVSDVAAYRARLETVISSAHIVKASNEDIEALYPGTAPRALAETWISLGASMVIITEGALGATAIHKNGAHAHSTPPEIAVADTIGAGDAFTSALLAYFAGQGLLSPPTMETVSETHVRASLAQAVAAGSFTCTRPGADPPRQAELVAFMRQYGPNSPGEGT
jgi:fructokinase